MADILFQQKVRNSNGTYSSMFSQTGIITYSATYSGGVFALNGVQDSNGVSAPNIKFIAPAEFADGNTFTVNGTAVTAKTQDGQNLSGGYFASGAVVSCFLNGSVLNFKAGGAALNLKVVGGTTQPATAKNYTIWVNTSVAVGAVTWSATAPASPAAGDVWVQLGASATVPIPINNDQTAWIYPSKVWQYESGTWVQKSAQTYQNGAWETMGLSLFLDGVDVTENTGGITSALYNWDGTALGNTIAIADNILNVTANNSVIVAFAGTANAIDLTDVRTIHAIVKQDAAPGSSYYLRMGAFSTRNVVPRTGPTVWLSTIGSYAQIDLDVSALSGSYYLAILKACSSGTEQIHVQKWWGE